MPDPRESRGAAVSAGNRTPARGRVLVVEDEAYVRASLDEVLRSRGFDVSLAGGVDEAMAGLAKSPVDVVLADLRMPGGGGLELVKRAHAAHPGVPVVRQHRRSRLRMPPDDRGLGLAERPLLRKDPHRDRGHADVVDLCGEAELQGL